MMPFYLLHNINKINEDIQRLRVRLLTNNKTNRLRSKQKSNLLSSTGGYNAGRFKHSQNI